ncbi:MAG: diphosphomevalonate decarboxylase [Phototrophicales bacterium]|nr:MAG: diphosphomevalonate decarboxylase [Phototrophicales bacterium]
MMKATSRATSNIAFVKYWGRINEQLRLPMNGSISMNLAAATTTTTVEFDPKLEFDYIHPQSLQLNEKQATRVFQHIDRIRKLAKIDMRAMVATQNNFPMGAGIASSASAFAALTVAAATAAGLELDTRELSILARQGSGSACRSVPSGFVEWHYGETNEDSYAEQIAPPDHWDIRNLIAITQAEHKTVGSAEGNALVETSPFNAIRVQLAQESMKIIRKAILDRDFTTLGEETEREAIRLHVIAMTSVPMILYWNPVTVRIMQAVMTWRNEGLESYFTIDAGANVHIIVQGQDADAVETRLRAIEGVRDVIHSRVGNGAILLNEHLF